MSKDRYEHITDAELLNQFYESRENEWLGALLMRYTLLLFGVCMKYLKNEEEARDCVQQVFMKAITELHKYKVEYIKSWLYMIAKNHCLMKLRNKSFNYAPEQAEHLAADDELENKLNQLEKDKTLTLLEESLNELNPEQNLCVNLFYLQKKSYQQIVEVTGFSLLQVKSYIQNGKRNLKIQLERKLKKH